MYMHKYKNNIPLSSFWGAVTVPSTIRGVVGTTRKTLRKAIIPSLLITGTDCER